MRPHQLIEAFPDGNVTVWKKAARELTEKVGTYRFEEQSVGINRYYQAAVANQRIDRAIKTQKFAVDKNCEYAAVVNGTQYLIKRFQIKPERNVYIIELQSITVPMKEAQA